MSIKINIELNELNELSYEDLKKLYASKSQEFQVNKYIKKRYERNEDFIEMMNETDDTNIKTIVALEKTLIDTAAGYGINKPVTYYDKSDSSFEVKKRKNLTYNTDVDFVVKTNDNSNEYLEKIIGVLAKNNTHKNDIKLLKNILMYGSSDEAIITNELGEIEIVEINDECLAFYDTSIKPKMIGFSRKVVYKDLVNDKDKETYELYLEHGAVSFDDEGKKTRLEYGGDVLSGIPFVRYDIEESYIKNLISQIRAYELVGNNGKKMLNYNDEAILMLFGYNFTNDEDNQKSTDDAVKEIKEKGVIFLDSEDGAKAEWLLKDINDTAILNHKQNLKDDIYAIAGTFNSSNDNQVYQNTLSLMFKMYGLETKMGGYVAELKQGFVKRIKKITEIINYKENKSYDFANIDMTFTRDLPTNVNEELNYANQMRDIVSLESIYDFLSFIENPKKELQKYKDWQLELAELNATKVEITSKGSVNEMKPDTAEDYKNSINEPINENTDEINKEEGIEE